MKYFKTVLFLAAVGLLIWGCDNLLNQPDNFSRIDKKIQQKHGTTPLPGIKGMGYKANAGHGSHETALADKRGYTINWEKINPLLERTQQQTESKYAAFYSLRDSSRGIYFYRTTALNFSPEAVQKADGRMRPFFLESFRNPNSPIELFAATIPDSKLAMQELMHWILTKQKNYRIVGKSSPKLISENHSKPNNVARDIIVDGTCYEITKRVMIDDVLILVGHEVPCVTPTGGGDDGGSTDPGGGGGNPPPDPPFDPGGGGPNDGGNPSDVPCDKQLIPGPGCDSCNQNQPPYEPCGSDGDPIKPCSSLDPPDYCDPEEPCSGNPIPNPQIAPSGGWNEWGRQFGYTRNGGEDFHDGTDIKAALNSDLYAMHGGEVVAIRNTFAPGEYKAHSYGNYIRIKSIINGETVYLRYNHLNYVGVEVGDIISTGTIIGKTGNTGNAQTRGGVPVIPHVHIRAREVVNGELKRVDPEKYMATKFNNDGSINESKSNCN